MANFETMIPFLLHCEAGLHTRYMHLPHEQQFRIACKTGFSCDPSDSGGATLCGVTIGAYRSFRLSKGITSTTVADLKRMTFSEWREILKTRYWDRWHADDILTPMIAVALTDWVWGSGKHGIIIPQRILGVHPDGIVGPRTLAALNGYHDQFMLFTKIREARNSFHASIARPGSRNAKFLKGWNNRVAKITWNGFKYS